MKCFITPSVPFAERQNTLMNQINKNPAILITGGAGYIGSHTCVQLLLANENVIIADNLINSNPKVLNRIKEITKKDFKFYPIDLCDEEKVRELFENNAIKSVIHFAGLKAVGESTAFPLKYYDNNLKCTLTLLKMMERFHVKKLVFSSSATVYGDPLTVPITEDFPLSVTNPYGSTKLIIENILKDVYKADPTWQIAILRYFNPIGAHESGLIGEDPNGIPNNLLPYISQVAVGKMSHLNVFGNDYHTEDGTGVRDYIHVVDLADGHLAALKKIEENQGLHIYNLGTGKGHSVLEMVSYFEKVSGVKIPYEIKERRAGDIASCYADTSKARDELHWWTKKNIEEMCKDTWNWQKKNPKGYA